VNIDMDKIECESCGAHLIFTALTSWSPAEGMLKVNKFFSLVFDFFPSWNSQVFLTMLGFIPHLSGENSLTDLCNGF
jgi:hypothetical protein